MIKGIKNKDIEDFKKACKKLNSIMERINIYNPDATLYLSNDIMNLMCGESHDDNERPLHDNVVSSVHIPTLNGGDW